MKRRKATQQVALAQSSPAVPAVPATIVPLQPGPGTTQAERTAPLPVIPSVPADSGPIPFLPQPGRPAEVPSQPAPYGWLNGAASPQAKRRRHLFRWLRRIAAVSMALVILGGVVFIGLMLVTPSVSNAPALARMLDRAHHAPYPGLPVPAKFAASLVSTEDHRFYSEPGIDPFAIGRLAIAQITGSPDQGGATLYQQLAKMLYTPGSSGIFTQAEQVVLGIKLDLAYSKPAILQLYSDVAYFGHGYYGLAQASCGYFGKAPDRLTWPQAAMLAGLVQAPSSYDPLTNLTAARARQAHVLGRLVATGKLTPAQSALDYQQPLHLVHGQHTRCAD
jgi:membrane peptidoglycan carboxypeptidase